MKININNIDVKNKMYVSITPGGDIYILKHFTIVHLHNNTKNYWRWISLDGKDIYNILLFEDFKTHKNCMFHDTSKEAVSHAYGSVYEFDDVPDMIKNWDKIKGLQK